MGELRGPLRFSLRCLEAALASLLIYVACSSVTTVVAAAPQSRVAATVSGHSPMAIGSAAPDFSLPGVDGRNHRLGEYAKAKVLAIVLEANHCPISQLYETRIRNLSDTYKAKGVA